MNEQEYAGFWIRVGAALIDIVVFLIVVSIPLVLIYGYEYFNTDKIIYGFWDFILSYVFPVIVTIWFWMRFLGTPGKMIMRLRVVDAKTRQKLSLLQAIGRYFAYIPAMLPFGLGIIWVGVDKNKQGWHDKLSGTVVIKSNVSEPVKFDN